jgi:hypothetical protein
MHVPSGSRLCYEYEYRRVLELCDGFLAFFPTTCRCDMLYEDMESACSR